MCVRPFLCDIFPMEAVALLVLDISPPDQMVQCLLQPKSLTGRREDLWNFAVLSMLYQKHMNTCVNFDNVRIYWTISKSTKVTCQVILISLDSWMLGKHKHWDQAGNSPHSETQWDIFHDLFINSMHQKNSVFCPALYSELQRNLVFTPKGENLGRLIIRSHHLAVVRITKCWLSGIQRGRVEVTLCTEAGAVVIWVTADLRISLK